MGHYLQSLGVFGPLKMYYFMQMPNTTICTAAIGAYVNLCYLGIILQWPCSKPAYGWDTYVSLLEWSIAISVSTSSVRLSYKGYQCLNDKWTPISIHLGWTNIYDV